ncbi:MAG: hypothetical protein WC073_17000 [Sterolibacterium sp.]
MKKLPAELKTAINKQSHRAGLVFAELTRLRLMAEAESLLTDGRTVPEIVVHLADALATKPKGSR